MINIDFKPTKSQYRVWEAWEDETSTSILAGAGVNTGKTYNLMALGVIKSLQYPGTRYLIGRKNLTNLMKTTAKTLWKVLRDFGLEADNQFTYNGSTRVFTFSNGSEIVLDHLSYEPSDPEVARLGGGEYTAALLDEVGDCDPRVIEVVHQRVGRCMNKEYSIKPLVIMTCNPTRGYLYTGYYQPWKEGNLPDFKAFLPSKIYENPYVTKEYIQHLENTLSANERDRMLNGSWDFASDPNQLTNYENLLAIYSDSVPANNDKYYITADIAFESDKCLVVLWNGLDVNEILEVERSEKPEDVILALQEKYKVQARNIIYDGTGAGLYLKNYLKGAYVFHAGAKPIKEKSDYEHLKTQCYFKFAEAVNAGKIRIFDTTLKEELIDECLQIKTLPKETLDGKIKMIKKDEIKKFIGRSPDILDALSMRMVREIKGEVDYYRF